VLAELAQLHQEQFLGLNRLLAHLLH